MYRKLTLTAAIVTLLAGGALAQDAHDHSGAANTPGVQREGARGKPGAADMAGMRENMKRMHEQMQKIVAAPDRAERQRLLDEHMTSMHATMSKMGGNRGADEGEARKMECMEMMRQMHAVEPAAQSDPVK